IGEQRIRAVANADRGDEPVETDHRVEDDRRVRAGAAACRRIDRLDVADLRRWAQGAAHRRAGLRGCPGRRAWGGGWGAPPGAGGGRGRRGGSDPSGSTIVIVSWRWAISRAIDRDTGWSVRWSAAWTGTKPASSASNV